MPSKNDRELEDPFAPHVADDDDREPVVILGQVIGTATGRYPADVLVVTFYDMQLNEAGQRFLPGLPRAADLTLDFAHGVASVPDPDGGALAQTADWPALMRSVPSSGAAAPAPRKSFWGRK